MAEDFTSLYERQQKTIFYEDYISLLTEGAEKSSL
jgi:hypothetical protein